MPLICAIMSTSVFNGQTNEIESINRDCLQDLCQIWDDDKQDCSLKISALFTSHIHDSHEHLDIHTSSTIPASLGASTSNPQTPPYASILINEFVSNEDKDGNDKVYGFDFQIDPEDTSKPPLLLSIENHPSWGNPELYVLWADLLAWYNSDGPDPFGS